jgi:hypothetical protein
MSVTGVFSTKKNTHEITDNALRNTPVLALSDTADIPRRSIAAVTHAISRNTVGAANVLSRLRGLTPPTVTVSAFIAAIVNTLTTTLSAAMQTTVPNANTASFASGLTVRSFDE